MGERASRTADQEPSETVGRLEPTNGDDRARRDARALRHLKRSAPELRAIIADVGPFSPKLTREPFLALVGAIVHQQVSMAAAKAILGRVRSTCPHGRITPAALLALGDNDFQAAGVSRQKRGYLRDLAARFATREITREQLRNLPDEAVIETLTRIKGVGRWTAEMLLIFSFERPDVWPVDDLGLRKAVGKLLGRRETPTAAEILTLADPWRPYRSYATWYLWRYLEGGNPAIA